MKRREFIALAGSATAAFALTASAASAQQPAPRAGAQEWLDRHKSRHSSRAPHRRPRITTSGPARLAYMLDDSCRMPVPATTSLQRSLSRRARCTGTPSGRDAPGSGETDS